MGTYIIALPIIGMRPIDDDEDGKGDDKGHPDDDEGNCGDDAAHDRQYDVDDEERVVDWLEVV